MSSDQMTHALIKNEQNEQPIKWSDYYRVKWEKRAEGCPCHPTKDEMTMQDHKSFCMATMRDCIQKHCPIDYWIRD